MLITRPLTSTFLEPSRSVTRLQCTNLLDISKSWAASLLARMNMAKRKGTRAARKICEDFDDVRMAFLTCFQNTIKEAGNSPPKLIINFDQTGCGHPWFFSRD